MFEDWSTWELLVIGFLIVAGIIVGFGLWFVYMIYGINRSERSENRQPESAPPPE